MKIVIALDSYKGSISSTAAADALASGLHSVAPDAEIAELTLADGGEGSLEAFAAAWNAEIFSVPAHDALMNPVEGKFAVSGTTAIVELAQICGLAQLGDGKSPLKATSFGFGEVIFHAFYDLVELGYRTSLRHCSLDTQQVTSGLTIEIGPSKRFAE